MAIITKADYKTFKGISASTYDTQLDAIIPQAQSMLELWAGRVFDSTAYTDEKYDGSGTEILQLNNFPVTTMTSIEIVDAAGNATVIPSNSYTVDLVAGTVKFEPSDDGRVVIDRYWGEVQTTDYTGPYPVFPEGHQNIAVTYTAGYSSGTMPAGLKLAMIQFVDYLMGTALGAVGSSQFKAERLGDYNYDRGQMDSTESVMMRLFGIYRRGAT